MSNIIHLKRKRKRTKNYIFSEDKIKDSLDDIFDNVHANALQIMSNVVSFCKSNKKKGRQGFISRVYIKFSAQREKNQRK